jgi:hypothetical protein
MPDAELVPPCAIATLVSGQALGVSRLLPLAFWARVFPAGHRLTTGGHHAGAGDGVGHGGSGARLPSHPSLSACQGSQPAVTGAGFEEGVRSGS